MYIMSNETKWKFPTNLTSFPGSTYVLVLGHDSDKLMRARNRGVACFQVELITKQFSHDSHHSHLVGARH